MKRYLKSLIALLVLLCIISYDLSTQLKKNDYKGIGFLALDYEKESGFEVSNAAYMLLDSIVNTCKIKIDVKQNYTYDEALSILYTIGEVIRNYNIKYDTPDFFSQALDLRLMDCKFFSLTYLTVGEILSLPLYSMIAPEHVFIYWNDKDNKIFWEATTNIKTTKQFYIDSLKIPEITITSLAYLEAMDYKKSMCIVFGYIGDVIATYKHDYIRAINYFNQAIEINPVNADFYNNRGLIKKYITDFSGALTDFNRALEINSNLFLAYNNRGTTNAELGNFKNALIDFNIAIEINSYESQTYFNRGLVKANLEDYNGAIIDFSNALLINSNIDIFFYNRGFCKSKIKDFYGAIEDYNKAIEINPINIESYINRGNCKHHLENYIEAIYDFDKAIQINPNIAEAFFNRGNAKYNLKDQKGACNDWKKASELGYKQADDLIRNYCK